MSVESEKPGPAGSSEELREQKRKRDAVYPLNRPVDCLIDLAEDVSALTEQMVRVPSMDPGAEAKVAELRALLRETTQVLEPLARGDRTPRMGPDPVEQRPFFATGVILGPHHPLQPELRIEYEPGVTRGTVHFGITFEGPPGSVHGGFVAHFFDQILGHHNFVEKVPAMTGSLEVRYLQATPLLTDLHFEVRHERDGERKVLTTGSLFADGQIFCEAQGLFIIPRNKDIGL